MDTSLLAPPLRLPEPKPVPAEMTKRSLLSPEDCSILKGFMDQLTSLHPSGDLPEDCRQAAILLVLTEGLMGVQSAALLQLLGRQMNAWARHTVASSAQLATQDDHKDELQLLAANVLGEQALHNESFAPEICSYTTEQGFNDSASLHDDGPASSAICFMKAIPR